MMAGRSFDAGEIVEAAFCVEMHAEPFKPKSFLNPRCPLVVEGNVAKRLFPFGYGLLFEPSKDASLTVEHCHETLPSTEGASQAMAHKLVYRAARPLIKGDMLSIPAPYWSGAMGFQVLEHPGQDDCIGNPKGAAATDAFDLEFHSLEIPELAEAPLRFGASPLHGMGAFATRDIHAGEVLEVVPTVPVEKYNIFTNRLHDYAYMSSFTRKMLSLHLGFGMVYNHREEANAVHHTVKSSEDHPLVEVWTAASFIAEGSEVFHNYGPNWWKERGDCLQC